MNTSSDVIVHETLFGRKPGEERSPITIVVERPAPWGGSSLTEYACWITVTPLFHRLAIHGEGPLQALALALRHVKWELNRFQDEGGSIQDCDLDATLPFGSLEDATK